MVLGDEAIVVERGPLDVVLGLREDASDMPLLEAYEDTESRSDIIFSGYSLKRLVDFALCRFDAMQEVGSVLDFFSVVCGLTLLIAVLIKAFVNDFVESRNVGQPAGTSEMRRRSLSGSQRLLLDKLYRMKSYIG